MSIDLLVFGPHPDDIEIGLGGSIARHTAEGRSVGLCDLTEAELSSNGTGEERRAEAGAAARVLGAAWRENLGWPDGGIAATPDMIRAAVDVIRRHRPRAIAVPYWDDRHPDHVAASHVLRVAAFQSGLRRYATDAEPWRPEWVCYYFINDSAPPSFVVDVSAHYQRKREALDCYRSQFAPAGNDAVGTRLTAATFRQLIESRDAQFGALAGVAFAEGVVVREPVQRAGALEGHGMNIGMVCYASVGGSGVVATELAHVLALRGHQVHIISSKPPFRWRSGGPGLSFVPVEVPPYPLFLEPQYLLALANTIVRVTEERQLDIVHAHYAVPHATAAYLAHQILSLESSIPPPRVVTTLHGTDITLIGSDPSYTRAVAFSIDQSHAVTAVSHSLKADTIAALGIRRDIAVIPNFLDGDEYRRRLDANLREQLAPAHRFDAVVIHVSNFRPVKRVDAVVEVFRRIRQRVRARLVLIGDGPVRPEIEQLVARHELTDDVVLAGEQEDLVKWLSVADLFLLPSAQESFGLAALEAMACGVPIVASKVGGLPEVVDEGVTGFLCPPERLDIMAERSVAILTEPSRHRAMSRAAVEVVHRRYRAELVVPLYEALYLDVVGAVQS